MNIPFTKFNRNMPPINCNVDLGISLYLRNSDLMDWYINEDLAIIIGRKITIIISFKLTFIVSILSNNIILYESIYFLKQSFFKGSIKPMANSRIGAIHLINKKREIYNVKISLINYDRNRRYYGS